MILGPSDWLAVMLAIARPYVRGQGPPTFSQVVEVSRLPGEAVQRVLESVSAAGLVFSSGEDRNRKIVLSKPPELIRLDHLLDLADPNTSQVGARGTRQANASKTSEPTEGSGIERLTATPTGNGVDGISQAVRSVHEKLRTAFSDQTLANLLDKPNKQ
jgi:DNA-binding IscR family transcriptional regulator